MKTFKLKPIITKFLILLTFGIISCTGFQVNCPDFDEKILSWMPYQANDVIELYSHSKNSTII